MDKDLVSRMDDLERKMDIIINHLETIGSSCDNMDNHIGFVMNIYERIKLPFKWLIHECDKRLVIQVDSDCT